TDSSAATTASGATHMTRIFEGRSGVELQKHKEKRSFIEVMPTFNKDKDIIIDPNNGSGMTY
ncbi:12317_t:CDS:2, partial [Racocetra persica]